MPNILENVHNVSTNSATRAWCKRYRNDLVSRTGNMHITSLMCEWISNSEKYASSLFSEMSNTFKHNKRFMQAQIRWTNSCGREVGGSAGKDSIKTTIGVYEIQIKDLKCNGVKGVKVPSPHHNLSAHWDLPFVSHGLINNRLSKKDGGRGDTPLATLSYNFCTVWYNDNPYPPTNHVSAGGEGG